MVELTLLRDIMYGCCAKTITSVPMLSKGCIEYYGGRTIDGDETKDLVTVSTTI